MINIKLIIGFLIFTYSCGKVSENNKNLDTLSITVKEIDTIKSEPIIILDYIIFGIFCGECGGECATMYKFEIQNNKLFVDHSDSFWKFRRDESPLIFETSINNKRKESIANEILNSIPQIILNSKDTLQVYGCPDCTDGCGIYFEISHKGRKRQFYIDKDTEELKGEIKNFSEFLKNKIHKIKRN